MKRFFDIAAAALGLAILSPLFLLAAALIKMESRGPVFFKQERMGKAFRPFFIYKFRTMFHDHRRVDRLITVGNDPRITRMGKFLRRAKIDELPQLLNVLKGDMSIVGPRPEVRRYVDLFRPDYEEILQVRPGITDLASIKYRDEAALLGGAVNPEDEYCKRLLPDKIELAKEYLRCSSFIFDLRLIFQTLRRIFAGQAAS